MEVAHSIFKVMIENEHLGGQVSQQLAVAGSNYITLIISLQGSLDN